MKKAQVILTAAFTILITAGSCLGQCGGYAVELFEGPDCQFMWPSAGVRAISEDGSLKGGYVDCAENGHSVIWWADGTETELPPSREGGGPGGVAINDSGEVAGSLSISNPVATHRAFLYSGGVTLNLGVLPGTNHNWSEAYGISNSGIVCGFSMNDVSGPVTAFMWQNGVMSPLKLPMGPTSIATDISDNERICGWMGLSPGFSAHGFIYDLKTQEVIDLGAPPSGAAGYDPRSINNHDDVCGIVYHPMPPPLYVLKQAFLWSEGTMIELGAFPGFNGSVAFALNDSKVVIGYTELDSIFAGPPFVWRNGIMYDLNDLIPKDLNVEVSTPWDINNAGQIAANGRTLDSISQIGLRLTPLPSPIGDFNCDAVIDVDDLLGVINQWGDSPSEGSIVLPPADFNYDATVGIQDLMIVIDNWTF